MNTTLLKKFAQEARTKLMTSVAAKLEEVLTHDSAALRAKAPVIERLKEDLNKIGRQTLIDKIAYIWFNRLVALRYMDANDFQSLGINILSPATGQEGGTPQILSDIHAGIFPSDLPLDRRFINDILNGVSQSKNPDNTVYRHILITVCNDLHRIFPFLFERIDDYSELLLPDDLTSPFSIIQDVVKGMPTEDCKEVEIIGWLYQFYISEKKDEVFASKGKVKKEDIPAATQLFTPRWIVEYMVQNTVGKLWLQNNPQSQLKQHMPYYIENESDQNAEYLKVSSVEEIKLLDQACGSGHILVYGFELFSKIYEEQGYSLSEIPAKIIENNLFGFEIDERAAQLAAFAIVMKARTYYRRFFRNTVEPNILCYKDVFFTQEELSTIVDKYKVKEKEVFENDMLLLTQATNFGSLIQPRTSLKQLLAIQEQLTVRVNRADLFEKGTITKLATAIKQLITLKGKYHCVVDNPPYMGSGNMNAELSDFVKTNYPKSKADLMACFMEAGIHALYPFGFMGMINQHSWMFLSSFEQLRKQLIETIHLDSLLHLGPRTFPEIGGEVVQNAAFTFANGQSENKGNYIRLVDYDSSSLKQQKTLEAIQNPNCGWFYTANQKDFEKIPGSNIGYWLSDKYLEIFSLNLKLDNKGLVRQGVSTSNNERFLRFWSEISGAKLNLHCLVLDNTFSAKWFPYNKGGEYRKWYGNQDYVINFGNNGEELKEFQSTLNQGWTARIKSREYYFSESLSWSKISSGSFSARYYPFGFIFDVAGCCYFPNSNDYNYLLGLLISNVSSDVLKVLSPTLNFEIQHIKNIPYIPNDNTYFIDKYVKENISISKQEWDSRETSWDFGQNELIRLKNAMDNFVPEAGQVVDPPNTALLRVACRAYYEYWHEQFFTLHKNEEELNRQFIEIYGLEDELTPDVPLEDITILKEEARIENGELVFRTDELIAQLISYAVGCTFGRYSLDKEGLILANQGETLQDYVERIGKSKDNLLFLPDADNIIPVLDEEWFDDDIVNCVQEFIRTVWGDEHLQTNLQYMKDALGKDLRRYLTKDFYKDHIKRYKKRPIYWLFSSPKGCFNVLVYMHRYTPDTLNLILNGYLRPFMEKVRNDIQRQSDIIITGTATEQGRARKRQDKLKEILMDCETYEYEVLHPLAGERISIDLDDGVLVNYNKLGAAVAPVPGLNDSKMKNKVKGFDWIDTTTIR